MNSQGDESPMSWAPSMNQNEGNSNSKEDSGYSSPFFIKSSPFEQQGTSTPVETHTWRKRLLNDKLESFSEDVETSLYEPMETDEVSSQGFQIKFSPEETTEISTNSEICKDINLNIGTSTPTKHKFGNGKKVKRSPRFLNGTEKLDILFQLGVKHNYTLAVSKIFEYLSDSDLSNITMVSKTWRSICLQDNKANFRWSEFVYSRKEIKENLCSFNQALDKVSRHSSWPGMPLLSNVRRCSVPFTTRQPPASPPVSPSKARFHMFQKEAEKLKEDEMLEKCPTCLHPATCTPKLKIGICSSASCAMQFCTVCKRALHTNSPCPLLSPTTPTKRNVSVNRKQIRRNLRRLLK